MKCYRCQNELPPRAMACPSCGQAVYTTGFTGQSAFGRRLDGCLAEEPSPLDYRATPVSMSLPRSVDLRPYCSEVEDQGRVGSCTANAVVGAMEYQLRKAGNANVELSRMFVYFNARRMSGHASLDCGTRISQGMAAFMAFGAPFEYAWPYNPQLLSTEPPPDVYKQALQHVPTEYARIEGIENIKAALAQGFPVVFAANLPPRCYDEAATTGIMQAPSEMELRQQHSAEGRHAMLLVGYDLADNTVIIRNSWGTGWGEKGYCRLAMDAFAASVAPGTTWILGTLEASGAFKVDRPAKKIPEVEGGVKDMAAKIRTDIRDSLTKDMKDAFKDIQDRMKPRRQ